jgi:hypothetical protein
LSTATFVSPAAGPPDEDARVEVVLLAFCFVLAVVALGDEELAAVDGDPPPFELPPSDSTTATITATPMITPPTISSVARAGERRSLR